ncbi:hypothetical protein EPA93_10900 [Ktedonosporobacter rubrisoli]|uniref:Uncharacterized protein n=1 Tax=Ktedonosporobacter rubrisoli TaxID=2509675 RepID=A0A4P6JMK4_KTERU|nr:hypothetical protein [Ktedonosporobacter rubrisoli]QBD76489.1 hypothetical protein EPA93_10900 [Ktedonosporobacter rubrisoli]
MFRDRPRLYGWYALLFLACAILLGSGLLACTTSSTGNGLPTQALPTLSLNTTPTAQIQQPYIASVPGPGCAKGANWGIGGRYKTIVTPTASADLGTNVIPTGTPGHKTVNDDSTVTTCKSDGLLVQHNAHYDSYATVIYESQAKPLPRHFRTQITATIVNGTDAASFDLGVRNQNENALSGQDNGYGNDSIEVKTDGSWSTGRTNDTTDDTDVVFSKGFVKPAKTFTLAAEVDGPRMTFWINDQKITTIVDATYPDSYGINFGISDFKAKSPPAALFSHFVYMPLIDTHLTNNNLLATATAQASKDAQASYTVATPGFGCDQGPGQWQPTVESRDYVTAHCQSQGLALSQPANTKYIGNVAFYGLNGNFPENYKVKVQIDVSQLNNGCAGLQTRMSTRGAGYAYFVCSNGFWQILLYDGHSSEGRRLAQGNVAQQGIYTMEATANGSTQSLALNGAQVAQLDDKTLSQTDYVELLIDGQGNAGTAVFSNFIFTPQP